MGKLSVKTFRPAEEKTFTFTFTDRGTGVYAFMLGRFGYDSALLSFAIISHVVTDIAVIKNFGDEACSIVCSGDTITVTTPYTYAGIVLISNYI